MKTKLLLPLFLALGLAAPAFAGAPATYQVTGPVLEVTDSKVVIQKGKEKWEISRDSGTKITGEVVVGSKITVTYTMAAATIKADPAAKTPAAPAAPKTPATPKDKPVAPAAPKKAA